MSVDTPRMVPVMAGRTCVGFLINQGPLGVEAYDANEKSLGIFPNAMEAAAFVERQGGAGMPRM